MKFSLVMGELLKLMPQKATNLARCQTWPAVARRRCRGCWCSGRAWASMLDLNANGNALHDTLRLTDKAMCARACRVDCQQFSVPSWRTMGFRTNLVTNQAA